MRTILYLLRIFLGQIVAVISQQQATILPPDQSLNSERDQGGVADSWTSHHCFLRADPAGPRAFFVGAFFQLHAQYDSAYDRCSAFLGRDAVEQMEAFFFAKDKLFPPDVNLWSKNEFGEKPWESFGWIARDTCASRVFSTYHALDLTVTTYTFYNSAVQSLNPAKPCPCVIHCPCDGHFQFSPTCGPFLQGVIGPGTDGEVVAVSPTLTTYFIPHISLWGRSPNFDDVNEYRYLFRTVPAMKNEVSAIIDLIEFFGWQYISVVVGDDDLHSGHAVNLFQNEQRLRQTFCIGNLFRFSQKRANSLGVEMARALRKDEKARVLVLFAPSSVANIFLEIMEVESVTGKIIIGSLDWVSGVTLDVSPILQRSMAVFGFTPRRLVRSHVDNWIDEYRSFWANSSSPERRIGLKKSLLRNPWLRAYLEDELSCRFEGASLCPSLHDSAFHVKRRRLPLCGESILDEIEGFPVTIRAEAVMFAVEILVLAIKNAFAETALNLNETDVLSASNESCTFPETTVTREALQKLTMPCLNDTRIECPVFNENQQVYPAFNLQRLMKTNRSYELQIVAYWVDGADSNNSTRLTWTDTPDLAFFTGFSPQTNSSRWPFSSCSTLCKPGERRFFYDEELVRCCWSCERCPENQISNSTNSDNCVPCELGTKPSDEFDHCVPSDTAELHYSDSFVIILLVLASIGFILTLLTMLLFCRHRDHKVVRSSNFYITMTILAACLFSHILSPFTVGTGQLTEERCRFSFLMLLPWKLMAVATILLKTVRYVLFFWFPDSFKRLQQNKWMLSTPAQICVILMITVVGFGFGVAYTSTITADVVYPSQTERRVICSGSLLWDGLVSAYHISLLVVAVVLAFLTRKLPENYNEAQQLYFTALATLVVSAGFTPALYVTDSYLRPLIVTVLAEAQMLVTWLCLYVPRSVLVMQSISKRA